MQKKNFITGTFILQKLRNMSEIIGIITKIQAILYQDRHFSSLTSNMTSFTMILTKKITITPKIQIKSTKHLKNHYFFHLYIEYRYNNQCKSSKVIVNPKIFNKKLSNIRMQTIIRLKT